MLTSRVQSGMAVLAFVTTMLALTGAACVAAMQFLHASRQLAALQQDREIAFRTAEAALRDAEADLLAAAASNPDRLAHWPAPGQCGTQAQRGICRPGDGRPAWWPWIEGAPPDRAPALPFGTITGARMPVFPGGMAGVTRPPHYLIEVLEHPAHALAGVSHWPLFRITALGQGRDPAVRVLLQAEFQP